MNGRHLYILFQAIWIVSFVATIALDVTYGLLVSVLFAMFITVLRTQRYAVVVAAKDHSYRVKAVELVRAGNTDVYVERDRYASATREEVRPINEMLRM
jgi:MFS superfamily sulfate permease-like transporter